MYTLFTDPTTSRKYCVPTEKREKFIKAFEEKQTAQLAYTRAIKFATQNIMSMSMSMSMRADVSDTKEAKEAPTRITLTYKKACQRSLEAFIRSHAAFEKLIKEFHRELTFTQRASDRMLSPSLPPSHSPSTSSLTTALAPSMAASGSSATVSTQSSIGPPTFG